MGSKTVLFFVTLLMAAGAAAHTRIYTYVDADGLKHFTDRPDDNRYRLLVLSPNDRTESGERYSPMLARSEDADSRAAAGQAVAPVVAIVTATLDLPWEEPIFAESAVRPIVITNDSADADRLAVAQEHADVMALPGDGLDLSLVFGQLGERGLRRVVCEGGAVLLASISAAGLLDEVDLTLAPLMSGGGQVVTGTGSSVPQGFSLTQLLVDDDGFVFSRYVREHSR